MLYKRTNSPYWHVAFYHENQRVRLSTKQKDKRLARKEAARLEYTYRPHKKLKAPLGKIRERYLKYVHSNKSKSTYRFERITLDRFCEWVGEKKIGSLLIEDYKDYRLLSVSERTINREYDAIRAMLNKAVSWGKIEENPCLEVKKYKIDPARKAPNYFTKQEVDLILYKCETYLKDMILFAVYTGLRQGELAYLQWKDINFNTSTVTVQAKDEVNWKPKSGRLRVIPIPEPCHKMLLEGRAGSLSRFIFANQFGKPRTNNLNRDLREFLRGVGLYKKGTGWHTFRHTYASHLAMQGVPRDSIAELLGHEDSRTTKIYAHLSPSHLKDMTDRLDFTSGLTSFKKVVKIKSNLRD